MIHGVEIFRLFNFAEDTIVHSWQFKLLYSRCISPGVLLFCTWMEPLVWNSTNLIICSKLILYFWVSKLLSQHAKVFNFRFLHVFMTDLSQDIFPLNNFYGRLKSHLSCGLKTKLMRKIRLSQWSGHVKSHILGSTIQLVQSKGSPFQTRLIAAEKHRLPKFAHTDTTVEKTNFKRTQGKLSNKYGILYSCSSGFISPE